MSQGKAWDKDEVILLLEPYFKLGLNVTKACDYAGIPRTTVQTWIEGDEELRLKVTAWQNEVSTTARKNWAEKIKTGNFEASTEWLKRKEKDEFSDRQEVTGADGKDLPTPLLNVLLNNDSDAKDIGTEEKNQDYSRWNFSKQDHLHSSVVN